ncbi:hypothetical protein ONS95_003755 [Cadophora gregata]|uniref:uncharacterized protein n=1 Tax=Cadophora gregata TaxID=51156 RepID=UPI0026DD12DE|nr:uncharacterized protein ONS95_003755 [Cadophora gregata]KAK0107044.1 hypothetical protein ONS95_003755 [Cadophora gregata]
MMSSMFLEEHHFMMANPNNALYSSLEKDHSSLSTLLNDDDLEKVSDEYADSTKLHGRFPRTFNTTYKSLITLFILLPWALLPVLFKIGEHQGSKILPKLPSHKITSSAVEYQLRILDDEFYTTEPENLKYKGHPRPELDDAWNSLIENMHMRVHPDEAKAAGFESVELADGSGDVYGLPVVFHNLHCLYSLRRAMFPNVYIDDLDSRPPGPNQINVHVDHCFDIIRQAIMCQGDMSMYYFYWPESEGRNKRPFPRHVGHSEHVCVNWEKLQSEAHKRHFSLLGEKKMLVNPLFPEVSLKADVIPKRKNYSVYDGNMDGPQLYEGLEDLQELSRIKNKHGGT